MVMTWERKNHLDFLSTQEKRVLILVAEAQTNKEIAAALGIRPATVKRHLENILNKLNLRNRVAAAVYAVRMVGGLSGLVNGRKGAHGPFGHWKGNRQSDSG